MTARTGHYLATSVADAGTVAADSELGDFVAENLQSSTADLAWRGNTVSTIQIDLAQSELLDCIALCIHNLTPLAFVKIDFYLESRNDAPVLTIQGVSGDALYGVNTGPFNAFGWNGVDVDVRAEYSNYIKILSATIRAQYIDVYIDDTGNADADIEIRRIKTGLLVKHNAGFEWGYKFGFVPGKGYRAGSISWLWLTTDELAQINELTLSHSADPDKLARTRGGELIGFDDDILWIGRPEASGLRRYQHTALVALTDVSIPNKPNSAQGEATLHIEEIYYGTISS